MADVEAALLRGRPPRYVQIPTAAAPEGEEVLARWLHLGAEQAARLGVEQVAVVARDRAEADAPDLADAVAGAGLVYLSGGNPAYLAATLRGTALWAAIVAAWEGGAALAGCSAGAMALTSWAPPPMRLGRRGGDPGLGLVPDLRVVPHFDKLGGWMPSPVLRTVLGGAEGVVTLGIDERTALVRGLDTGPDANGDGDRWVVHGHQSVWRIGPDGRRTQHRAGDVVDA
jgi:cyanophycinase-like exopeptidase